MDVIIIIIRRIKTETQILDSLAHRLVQDTGNYNFALPGFRNIGCGLGLYSLYLIFGTVPDVQLHDQAFRIVEPTFA